MNIRAVLIIRVLLATVIAVAGVPVHGAMMSTMADDGMETPQAAVVDNDADSADPHADCPGQSQSVQSDSATKKCDGPDDCCSTECRLACAGLTLFVPGRLSPPAPVPLFNAPANTPHLLTSVFAEGLLRPPQA